MYVGPDTFFLIVILITGSIGFARGWRREIITLAIELAAGMFLTFGGIWWLWDFIFVKIPQAFRDLFFGPEQFGVNPPSVWKPDPWGQFFSISAFVGLTALAYLVGGRFGVRAASGWARVVGFVVGIGNGVAMLWYTSHQILHGYSLVVVSGNAGLTDSWLAPVLGLGLVVAFVGLLVAGGKGGGGH